MIDPKNMIFRELKFYVKLLLLIDMVTNVNRSVSYDATTFGC